MRYQKTDPSYLAKFLATKFESCQKKGKQKEKEEEKKKRKIITIYYLQAKKKISLAHQQTGLYAAADPLTSTSLKFSGPEKALSFCITFKILPIFVAVE